MNDKKPRRKPATIESSSTTKRCPVRGCKKRIALSEEMCDKHKKELGSKKTKVRRPNEFERAKPKQQRRKSRI